MTDRDPRIEAAHRAAKAKYLRWHPEMKDSPGVTEHVLDEILEVALAAADAAVPRAAWWEKCGACLGVGEGEPLVFDPCPHCNGEGRRLVFAPCDTCKGSRRVSSGEVHEVHGSLADGTARGSYTSTSGPCPDCDDGKQRRRLLEQMGGERRYIQGATGLDYWWTIPEVVPEKEIE